MNAERGRINRPALSSTAQVARDHLLPLPLRLNAADTPQRRRNGPF